MGASQGKPKEEELPRSDGVQITKKLLDQLHTKTPQSHPQQSAPAGEAAEHAPGSGDADLQERLAQDSVLQCALAVSQRVGRLLLKAEAGELALVDQLAGELLQNEHSVPAREVPCESERGKCMQCYMQHAQEPLRCASAVDAYIKCSQRASEACASS
ncbi:hypothetical protein WJX81_007338 [Elliptochloris bilobata]|uniref:Uncharacterized protein n=1 Tax=Elliptochloris bilobata TaxID=381761 RepID=A0AAW1SHT3_9CHLO